MKKGKYMAFYAVDNSKEITPTNFVGLNGKEVEQLLSSISDYEKRIFSYDELDKFAELYNQEDFDGGWFCQVFEIN